MGRFAIIEGDLVINVVEADADFAKTQGWVEAPVAGIGWLWDGEQLSPPPPVEKRPEQVRDEIVEATQQRLDDFARTRGYDGILSACTYATSSVLKFQREGQYCVEARDATWFKLYETLTEVQAGTRPIPVGFADVEPELPALSWPM